MLIVVSEGQSGRKGQVHLVNDQLIRMNQVQVIGTHNSYHAGLERSEAEWLLRKHPLLAKALDYRHAPLDEQLDAGTRQIELDVFADPPGGRYAYPKVTAEVAAAGLAADPDFDPRQEMEKPGFKVMHLQDLDQRSSCHLLVSCLEIVKTWSRSHPRHLPLFVLIECKTGHGTGEGREPEQRSMTPELFDALDGEIRSVFAAKELITPDLVRGAHPSLREAIESSGWPTLAVARGKVKFLLDNRDLAALYSQGHPGLRGRILFPNAEPGSLDAAFTEVNGGPREKIEELVRKGYLVRTRADTDTLQARSNDTGRRDAAIASGAQMVSTDYPLSEPSHWSGYRVGFANGSLVRCDPVNRPAICSDAELER